MNKFSKYLKLKKPIIKDIISRLSAKYQFASCLATDVKGTAVGVDFRQTTVSPSSDTESGFVFRVFNGEVYSELSVSELNNVELIISSLDELTSAKMSVPHVKSQIIEEEEITKSFKRNNKGDEFTTEEIVAKLKDVSNNVKNYSDMVINTRLRLQTNEYSKMYISTKKDLEQYYTWSNSMAMVVVRKDANIKYSFDSYGINSVSEAIDYLYDNYKKATDLAIELLDATVPEPGVYDVITDPSITGLIAHEAFGHGVEMDMFVKDRAMSKEYMNKMVASPILSMRDGAKACISSASYFFDDDGVLAQDTQIIKNGKLVSGLSDALSAQELGTKATGNGRRESYKRKSYSRMTNTFFEKGKDKLEDMIKSIDNGFLIAQTSNGMEDPKNWGIQCTALYGREIKNGELTGKIVAPVVMSGYVIDLLESITMISDEVTVIGSGSCGKGYKEWVSVSDGGAYMKASVKIG